MEGIWESNQSLQNTKFDPGAVCIQFVRNFTGLLSAYETHTRLVTQIERISNIMKSSKMQEFTKIVTTWDHI
jgi:hypothetical protein